ncbi:MAG: D-alanyl-D-alanine carboxypeptidase [Rubrivivax sp.]|jgi:D-alanyl-D-alanine carboxypeptidase (penicillin-binding protein 5/6)|nr:D-alanyl-D-alanine carboxypeptidase [Rubrivivax sp.]
MRFLILLATLIGLALPVRAQLPQPPEIAARQYILVDLASQRVLAERDADAQADPASLTKLMTAYLAFNAIRDGKLTLQQEVPVSMRAWAERKGGGSLMFIDTTMHPKVEELLRGVIVQSGNDASVALAEAVGGTLENFVEMMNRQAQAWGLSNTQFRNVTGLTEPGHHSSARDVATIAAKIIAEHPQFYALYSTRQYTYNRIKQDNRNLLLGRDPSVDGMKTGYTEAAGYCLVASAQRETPSGKRRLLSVVMGTASREARAAESQKLLNWGYSAWDALRLFEAGAAVATVPVWKGATREVRLGTPEAIVVTLPKGEGGKLQTTIERTDPLVAPLVAGQRVGTLKVATASGAPVAAIPLTALEPVALAGVFGRAWDAIRLWIK